jgi:hypothetical protein
MLGAKGITVGVFFVNLYPKRQQRLLLPQTFAWFVRSLASLSFASRTLPIVPTFYLRGNVRPQFL